MMTTVITVSAKEGRLCKKGILLVRMTWMIIVCVNKLSTNQPVWNKLALCAAAVGVDVSQQWNR